MSILIPRSDQQLRSVARGFLAESRDCMALAPTHHGLLSLVEQFADGRVDRDGLRAAFGGQPQRADMPKPGKKVAVLYLTGLLTPGVSLFTMLGIGTSIQSFMTELRAAAEDPNIAAIYVVIDTPGGSVNLLPEAAALVREVRRAKPIVGEVVVINASSGYWLSSNFTVLSATQSADVGAIGVYGLRVSQVRQLDREGIDVAVFSAGKFKTEGLPVTPVTNAEREASTARVNEKYGEFVDDVAEGRRVSTATVRSGFGEGRLVSAKAALKLGMIDRIETLSESITRLVQATSAGKLSAMYPIRESGDDHFRARLEAQYGVAPRERYAGEDVAARDEDLLERMRRMY